MEEDSKAETLLHPYELRFSDLLLLSSDEPLSSSSEHDEIQRLESITSCIMENLGPNGPGLLAITGVPGASSLRSSLLRFAPKLALLDFRDLNRLLKVFLFIFNICLLKWNLKLNVKNTMLFYTIIYWRI